MNNPEISDYDAGLLGYWGGGNVQWWQDYIRSEIGRANDYWRSALEAALAAAEEHMKARPAPAQDDVSWRRVGMLEGLLEGITLRSDVPQDVKNKIKAALRQEGAKS